MKKPSAGILVALLVALVVGVTGAILLITSSSPAHHGPRPHNPNLGRVTAGTPTPRTNTAVPSVLVWDSVTVDNIPSSARYAACYASGSFANCGSMRAHLPHATLVSFATWDGATARCLDVEWHDATPWQAPGWVRRMLALGIYRPCVYAAISEMPSVREALNDNHLSPSLYFLWDAHWTGRYGIDVGFDATQFFNNCCVDQSAVADYFFNPRPKPKPVLVCFGAHATPRAKKCVPVVRLHEKRQRALTATHTARAGVRRALARDGCQERQKRSECVKGRRLSAKLLARYDWFQTADRKLVKEYTA